MDEGEETNENSKKWGKHVSLTGSKTHPHKKLPKWGWFKKYGLGTKMYKYYKNKDDN